MSSTPSQTVGPYLSIGLDWGEDGRFVVPRGTAGAFWIRGRLFDGAGEPVPDGMIESWQAAPDGRYAHPDDPRGAADGFRGFARCLTDAEGSWAIHTVKPGRVPDAAGVLQAPHLALSVFARGLLHRVVTRVYFADEAQANATDGVLGALADPERAATLLAARAGDGYSHDIRLQGDRETVFFAV